MRGSGTEKNSPGPGLTGAHRARTLTNALTLAIDTVAAAQIKISGGVGDGRAGELGGGTVPAKLDGHGWSPAGHRRAGTAPRGLEALKIARTVLTDRTTEDQPKEVTTDLIAGATNA